MTETADLTQILAPEQLTALRQDYDGDALSKLAAEPLRTAYPACAPWIDWMSERFYGRTGLRPEQRELILIALLGRHPHASGLLLAVHLYWGLMVGLSPRDIADALLLVGAYAGIPSFTVSAHQIFRRTLEELGRASELGGEETQMRQVLARLQRAFA